MTSVLTKVRLWHPGGLRNPRPAALTIEHIEHIELPLHAGGRVAALFPVGRRHASRLVNVTEVTANVLLRRGRRCPRGQFTVAEKLSTARPTPPFHGSNPAWMLVRYQELVIAPRARTSLTKSSTLNDHELIGDGAT
jgi:hypothetical protein